MLRTDQTFGRHFDCGIIDGCQLRLYTRQPRFGTLHRSFPSRWPRPPKAPVWPSPQASTLELPLLEATAPKPGVIFTACRKIRACGASRFRGAFGFSGGCLLFPAL